MEFPKLTDNLSIIAALGDNPGTDDGLSAEELKAKFDEAALILQRYLNGTLVERLNEIFAGGPGVPSNGFNMNGPINMNRQPIWNVRDPVGDGDALNLQFANANYAPKNHVENNNNPHGVTAEQVGARPDTWFPTIAEIGAAPSGYGLGTGATYGNSPNSVFNGGFYRWDTDNDQTPFANGVYLVVPRAKDSSAAQIAVNMAGTNKGCIASRVTTTAAVGEWEYINPPMAAGTSYQTTERWNGKPVYAKLINLGTLQSSGTKNHNTGLLKNENITFIDLCAMATDGTYQYDMNSKIFTAGHAYYWTNGSGWYVNINCNSDMSSLTGKAIVKWVYN